ncbi:MAG: DegT/DnrJ/EryC1/StrS family aminotransferase, partial [Muribaculaceae bacterium]|nr:DegT/DnrJ/EryC1/StrS family aminotransferase [Muribaculaceae bacterium]
STTEYFHKEIGYNYRLSNISAAIGCAQLEDLDRRVKRRKAIHRLYTELLSDCKYIEVKQNPNCDFDSNFWLTTILLSEDSPLSPLQLCERLKELNIETRRLWRPMHTQPIYANAISFLDGTSEDLFARGLCLPSSTTLSDDEIKYVASEIKRLIEEID